MGFDPEAHRRRSIRLPSRDYARAGAYFVTICVHTRECLLGVVERGAVIPSDAGKMIAAYWEKLPIYDSRVRLDTFVVMPNHLHGIVVLDRAKQDTGRARRPAPTRSVPDLMQRFKSITTAAYRKGVAEQRWPPFLGRLWQRGYYERVLRGEEELHSVREYIRMNPQRWESDPENPNSPPDSSPPRPV